MTVELSDLVTHIVESDDANQFSAVLEQYLQEGTFAAYDQWVFGTTQNLAAYQNWIGTHNEEYQSFAKAQQGKIFKVPDAQYYH